MSTTWGRKFQVTIFGESHGAAIGVVIDGLPAGLALNEEFIASEMKRRSPKGKEGIATARKEADVAEIVSGYFNGRTTGTPLCAIIRNSDTRSSDYEAFRYLMRPGHSDWGYYKASGGYNDYRGGGHSSGRITAPIVFAGAVAKQILAMRGINVAAHIARIADVEDDAFDPVAPQTDKVNEKGTLNVGAWEKMEETIRAAAAEGDSVGGVIECAVTGIDAGVGRPFFDSVESQIAHLMFSVPAVKGIQFGAGYRAARMKGSEMNDPFRYGPDGSVRTVTNNNGGILGGLTDGMPVIFDVAVKPTPSVYKEQDTVDVSAGKNARLQIKGRHDPCIVVRALPVIEAMAAIAVCDMVE